MAGIKDRLSRVFREHKTESILFVLIGIALEWALGLVDMIL